MSKHKLLIQRGYINLIKMEQEKQRKQFVIVNGLVVNKRGQVLFVRRERKWHKEAHNKWELPGGKIDFGENPEKTAIREAKEETGYNVRIEYLLPKILSSKWVAEDKESQQILICYMCRLNGGKKSLKDHGVNEIKWFDIAKVPNKKECLPGTIEFLNIYKNTAQERFFSA